MAAFNQFAGRNVAEKVSSFNVLGSTKRAVYIAPTLNLLLSKPYSPAIRTVEYKRVYSSHSQLNPS